MTKFRRVEQQQAAAKIELDKAMPAVREAMAALDTLNKKELGEAKGMAKPPAGVDDVFAAVITLLAGCSHFEGPVGLVSENIVLDKKGRVKDKSWNAAKKQMLGDIGLFMQALTKFLDCVKQVGATPAINWSEVRPILALEHMDPEVIRGKNSAAAGLCAWAINIVKFRDINVKAEPLRVSLREAEAELAAASDKLKSVKEKVDHCRSCWQA